MKKILSFLILWSVLICNITYAEKVAVIGGGAAGIMTAWLLEQDHEVTLYEAQDHLGGHANSIEINVDGSPVVVEAGAEFFNETFYPHFYRLLKYFNLPLKSYTLVSTFYRTDMDDKIILPPYHDRTVEWISLTPGNVYRSLQLKTVIDNGRDLIKRHDTTTTLQEYVNTLVVSEGFKSDFLYPLLASAWGVTINEIQNFSAYNAVMYLVQGYDTKNYQWLEVTGGLKEYVKAVQNSYRSVKVKLNQPVTHIEKFRGRYAIFTKHGDWQEYDHIVFATNAQVASQILMNVPEMSDISQLLAKVKYFDTKIAIHSDKRFMPADSKDWRIVNIRYDGNQAAATMYKEWVSKTPIFKSWITYDVRNPKDNGNPLPEKLYALITYKHPIADKNFFEAQDTIKNYQGIHNMWFAGMWTHDGDSHESAITSAMKIAERLAPSSDRLKILQGKISKTAQQK